jgi:hypothetical protein
MKRKMTRKYDEELLEAAIQREIDKVNIELGRLLATEIMRVKGVKVKELIDFNMGRKSGLEYAKFIIRE